MIAVAEAPTGAAALSPGQALLAEQELVAPAAVRLAELASIATFIEPELLRRLRLEVDPGVAVDAEADLWLGPLVESRAPRGIVLRRDVVGLLRDRVAATPERLASARRIVDEVHASTPRSAQLEEEIVWLALAPGDHGAAIEERLRSVTKAMVDQPARSKDLARWAVRAVPRLPAAARETVSAWTLALNAGARLDGRQVLAGDAPAGALDELASLLPTATSQRSVGVRATPAGLEVSMPPDFRAATIEVPETNPIVLGIAPEADPPRTVSLRSGETQAIDLEPTRIELLTADGGRWEVQVPEAAVTLVLLDDPATRAAQLSPRPRTDEEGTFIVGSTEQLGDRTRLRMAFRKALAEGAISSLLSLGEQLAKSLPGELWDALAAAVSRVSVAPSVLIVAESDDLPWELAVLPQPFRSNLLPFLGVQCEVGSWIVPRERRDLPRPRPLAIDVRTFGAAQAQRESEGMGNVESAEPIDRNPRDELIERYGAHEIRGIGELRRWLHAVGPDLLQLTGDARLDPSRGTTHLELDGDRIDVNLFEREAELPATFIYLGVSGGLSSFEPRAQIDLNPLVDALLATGSGAVVAPTTALPAPEADDVARRFWERALRGVRPAEALRQLRAESADSEGRGVATLGYRFFGHPFTHLVRRSSIRLWNLTPQGGFGELTLDAGELISVAWSPDGSRLVTGSDDGAVLLWASPGQHLGAIGRRSTPIRQVAWSPDGNRVAVASREEVSIWAPIPAAPGEPVAVIPVREAQGLAWSPGADRLAVVDGEGLLVADCTTGEPLQRSTSDWHSGTVAWPLESAIVSALGNGGVVSFAASTLAHARPFEADMGLVTAHAVSPDGSTMVLCDDQGTIVLVDVRTGKVIRRMPAQSAPYPVTVIAAWLSATELRTADEAGSVTSWSLPEGRPSPVHQVIETPGAVFSPDGTRLATVRSAPPPATGPGDRGYATSAA